MLTVEDGSGIAAAESYAAISDVAAYAVKYGKTFATSPAAAAETACRVATKWIDANYRSRFPGEVAVKTQALEWPRKCVWYRCEALPSDTVPQQIIDAMCEAAIRELAVTGTLMPDIDAGAPIKSLKAGSVQIDYGGAFQYNATFQAIDGILSALLGPTPSRYSMSAVRG